MELYLIFSAALLGAVVGSFLNVVILRLPRTDRSIIFPASHCPRCKQPLRWFDNIPIISYLLLRGRCRTCGKTISLQYPLVELAMAVLAAVLAARFALSFAFILYFIFFAALLVIIFIDFHHQIIPDRISLPGIAIGFAGSFFNDQVTWQQSGLGILLGGGILYAVAYGYFFLTRREGMGGGDIKLLAMIGAFLGWQSLLFVVFSSSVAGSVVGVAAMIKQKTGARTRIPYGPFLALGAMAYLIFNDQINSLWTMYLSMSGF
ncbi:prepilin peptidase [Desulfobulbus alkaliphilus]|uniref:prepilin peptidase n=1 Tax=Desulfobulbus alkaliphilus TaxID=869814 RepID=UPI001964EB9D|nr:A24 family peptidase [Desulfobulbus alkaliphilus]MBM9536653.1 prepilin peptidase [Desulfobulbus alkaliphilus]